MVFLSTEKLIVIGASDELIEVPPNSNVIGRRFIMGWPAGTSIDSQDTLSFSVLSGVRSMSEVFPLERAAEAYEQHDERQGTISSCPYNRTVAINLSINIVHTVQIARIHIAITVSVW